MRPDEAESRHRWRWLVLGAAALLFVCSQFYRVANAVVAPELQRDLGLSPVALGGLSAAFFWAFAAAQVPLAIVLDRVGARRSMAVLSLMGAVGAGVFATADGLLGATAGRVLLGLGMAANLMGSMKLIAHWFSPREFGTVGGILVALGTLGNMAATTPLALMVKSIGWRSSFGLIAAGTAMLVLLFWTVVRERPPHAPIGAPATPPPVAKMLRRLLASRDYWLISIGAFARYGAFVAIQGLWAGPYLMEVVGLPATEAANLILLLNVAFVVGSPLGGWLSDRVLSSRKKVALLSLAGTAMAELALALGGDGARTWVIALVFVLLGVTSAFGQLMYAHIKELMPAEMAGMAMTGVNFFVMLGAATFVYGMGWVLGRASPVPRQAPAGGYGAAFLAAGVGVALAFGAYCFTRERRTATAQEPSCMHPGGEEEKQQADVG